MSSQPPSDPPKRPSSSFVPAAKAGIPKVTLEDIAARQEATRRLLDEHVRHTQEERKATNAKLDRILELLGDVIGRLPDDALKPSG